MGEPNDGDDPRNINVIELEGIRDTAAPKTPDNKVQQPLKTQKVNIRMKEDPKFANVGDY